MVVPRLLTEVCSLFLLVLFAREEFCGVPVDHGGSPFYLVGGDVSRRDLHEVLACKLRGDRAVVLVLRFAHLSPLMKSTKKTLRVQGRGSF